MLQFEYYVIDYNNVCYYLLWVKNMATVSKTVKKILSDTKTIGFFVPFVFACVIFAVLNVYPFGTKTMLTVDLYHQYMPFVYELRARILGGRSLFYSWNTGLGTEYYAAFANYAASPLNLLCIFFPYKALPVFVAFVTALRAGLASLTMLFFLECYDKRRSDGISLIFAFSYAFCGWFLTDFWNIMWCDAWVLLPLICLGLIKIYRNGDMRLYTISLAICLFSNYYAGYFVCLFLVFFSVVLYFAVVPKEEAGIKSFLNAAWRFALGSIIAGAISAVVIIPTYLILTHSSATGDTFPTDYNLTGNLFDFLGRLLPTANPNIRDGMANVAGGTLTAMMLPLFFMAPKESGITLRHKIGFGFMLALMYLSFTNRILNFIWHGFHFPNQIPYRESFLMCFLMVVMAYQVMRKIKFFTLERIGAVFAAAFLFLVLYEKIGEGNEGYRQIGLGLLFLAIQGIALRAYVKAKREDRSFGRFVLVITVAVEVFVSGLVTIASVAKAEGFTGYDYYGKNRDIIHSHTVEIEGTEGHLPYERTELYPNNICCIQSVYDIKGISVFSSTARESFIKYMRNFGLHNNGINGLRNAGLTRVTATLFGIRNLATIEKTSAVPPLYDEEWSDGEVIFYGNPDALAVGYMVSEDLLAYQPDDSFRDVFAKTNDLVRYMGVEADCYLPISVLPSSEDNVTYTGSTGNSLNYSLMDQDKKISFEVDVVGRTIGSDLYIYVDSNKGGTVSISSETKDSYSFEIRSYQVICLGKYEGVPVHVTLTYNKPPKGSFSVFAYELNNDGYEKMVSALSDDQLEVTSYDDTSLNGTIDVSEDGILLLTIPYSEGLTATVDGVVTEITPVQDALCSLKLDKGTHDISLTYKPAGFMASAFVSLAGVASLAFICILPKISPKVRRKADNNG